MRKSVRHLPIVWQKKFKFSRNRKNSGVQKVSLQNYNNNSIQKIWGEVMHINIKI